jgi:hypothetical protein
MQIRNIKAQFQETDVELSVQDITLLRSVFTWRQKLLAAQFATVKFSV